MFPEVKDFTTSDDKSLGFIAARKFRSIISIIIESGMALFAIQLARLAITATGLQTNVESDVFAFIAGTHPMLNVNINYTIGHHDFMFTDNMVLARA